MFKKCHKEQSGVEFFLARNISYVRFTHKKYILEQTIINVTCYRCAKTMHPVAHASSTEEKKKRLKIENLENYWNLEKHEKSWKFSKFSDSKNFRFQISKNLDFRFQKKLDFRFQNVHISKNSDFRFCSPRSRSLANSTESCDILENHKKSS